MNEYENTHAIFGEVSSHREILVAYAFAILRDWDEAEDAVHDAFVIAMKKISTFQRDRSVLPWIRGIVRFQCLKRFDGRKRNNMLSTYSVDYSLLNDSQLADRWMKSYSVDLIARKIAFLEQCLESLPEKTREYLYKYYVGNFSCEEIASEINRSTNGFRVTICRLRRRLKDCMRERMEESDRDGALNPIFDKYMDGALCESESMELYQCLENSSKEWSLFMEHILFVTVLRLVLRRQSKGRGRYQNFIGLNWIRRKGMQSIAALLMLYALISDCGYGNTDLLIH